MAQRGRSPMCYRLLRLQEYDVDIEINGRWVPARPLSSCLFWDRITYAWLVFTGKYDVFYWPENQ